MIVRKIVVPWITLDPKQGKYIYRTFKSFFEPKVCIPYALLIIQIYFNFVMETEY